MVALYYTQNTQCKNSFTVIILQTKIYTATIEAIYVFSNVFLDVPTGQIFYCRFHKETSFLQYEQQNVASPHVWYKMLFHTDHT